MPLVYNRRFNSDLHMYGAPSPSRPNVLYASNAFYNGSTWSKTGASATSFINLTTTKPPFLRLTANNGYIYANTTGQNFHTAKLYAIRFDVSVQALVNGRVAFWIQSQGVSSLNSTPGTQGLGIRCSTVDGDVNWQGVAKGNGNTDVIDLGIPPSASAIQRIEWRYYPKERFDCYIDGVRVLRHADVNSIHQTDSEMTMDFHVRDYSAGVNPCILDLATLEAFMDL